MTGGLSERIVTESDVDNLMADDDGSHQTRRTTEVRIMETNADVNVFYAITS